MSELTKTQFIQSQFLVILGLLEHTSDNIEGTLFEDEKILPAVLGTLIEGCQIVKKKMAHIVEQEEDDDCCGCC